MTCSLHAARMLERASNSFENSGCLARKLLEKSAKYNQEVLCTKITALCEMAKLTVSIMAAFEAASRGSSPCVIFRGAPRVLFTRSSSRRQSPSASKKSSRNGRHHHAGARGSAALLHHQCCAQKCPRGARAVPAVVAGNDTDNE